MTGEEGEGLVWVGPSPVVEGRGCETSEVFSCLVFMCSLTKLGMLTFHPMAQNFFVYRPLQLPGHFYGEKPLS